MQSNIPDEIKTDQYLNNNDTESQQDKKDNRHKSYT